MNLLNIPYIFDTKSLLEVARRIERRKIYSNFGPEYEAFVNKLSRALKLSNKMNLCFTSSGHSALLACLYNLKNNYNISRYISPSWSFISTRALSTLFTKHKHLDVEENGFISLKELQNIKNSVVMVVSPFGELPTKEYIEKLLNLSRKNSLHIIFDFAAALPSVIMDKTDLIQQLLDIGPVCFSLHATKLISTLEGGCIVSKKDDHLLHRRIINFGLSKNRINSLKYGFNGKMSEINAGIGQISLKWFIDNSYKLKKNKSMLCRELERNDIKIFNKNSLSLTLNVYKNKNINIRQSRRWWQLHDKKPNAEYLHKNIIGIPIDLMKDISYHKKYWFKL
jgi:dTDP-4-amino-4,6-dideoxygalactose transaminase